jgi:exonuclease III
MKLLLILACKDIDIFCIQETWIAEGAHAPCIEGFQLVESRRPGNSRGGLATYVRKHLKIETNTYNEYGILTKIILPNSTRINVINIYLPPY